MPRRKSRTLTDVELEFMQIVWSKAEVSTEELRRALLKQGRDLADGSIRKVLSILVDKGYLARRREGRGFLYRPLVEKTQANRSMVRDLLKRAFGGSAALMVASLVDTRGIRKKDLEEIRKLLDEKDKGAKQ